MNKRPQRATTSTCGRPNMPNMHPARCLSDTLNYMLGWLYPTWWLLALLFGGLWWTSIIHNSDKTQSEIWKTYGSDSAGRGKCLFYVTFFKSRRLVWPNQKILTTSVDLCWLIMTFSFWKNWIWPLLSTKKTLFTAPSTWPNSQILLLL